MAAAPVCWAVPAEVAVAEEFLAEEAVVFAEAAADAFADAVVLAVAFAVVSLAAADAAPPDFFVV